MRRLICDFVVRICHKTLFSHDLAQLMIRERQSSSFQISGLLMELSGGSVVECRTPEREVRGSRPTAAVLCPWARHFTPRKYWLITQEAMAPSRHDWKIVDWDVKPQHNQPKEIWIIGASSRENLSSGFATRVDSNRPAQPQKLGRDLKFWI